MVPPVNNFLDKVFDGWYCNPMIVMTIQLLPGQKSLTGAETTPFIDLLAHVGVPAPEQPALLLKLNAKRSLRIGTDLGAREIWGWLKATAKGRRFSVPEIQEL
jgi:hypothetical protein